MCSLHIVIKANVTDEVAMGRAMGPKIKSDKCQQLSIALGKNTGYFSITEKSVFILFIVSVRKKNQMRTRTVLTSNLVLLVILELLQ
jgi:hypothetical protein